MKLVEAQELAKEVIKILFPLCVRIEVAGSIRRKKAEVRDVDIVLIPNLLVDIVGILQSKMQAKVEKRGKLIISLKIGDVGVDLNLATTENFAPLLLFRTGSWESNMRLATKAQQKGLKFSPYGVFNGDKRIDDNTEEGIFSALGEEYVPPEERN
ncbi:MAG: hypothetical protein V1915_01390 [Candidatus Bathyarchaeota archaeon]